MRITVEAMKWSSRGWVRDVRGKEKIMKPSDEPLCKLTFLIYRQKSCIFVKCRAPSQLVIKQPRFKILQKMRVRKILGGGGGWLKPGQLVRLCRMAFLKTGLSVLKAHFRVPGSSTGEKWNQKSYSEGVRIRQKK